MIDDVATSQTSVGAFPYVIWINIEYIFNTHPQYSPSDFLFLVHVGLLEAYLISGDVCLYKP